jgi:hypothetical protein
MLFRDDYVFLVAAGHKPNGHTPIKKKEESVEIRKNQKNVTTAEWRALIAAIDAMHGTTAAAPAYRRFVSLHTDAMTMTNMNWSVHTMRMGGSLVHGKNFLTWHTGTLLPIAPSPPHLTTQRCFRDGPSRGIGIRLDSPLQLI